MSLAPTSRQTSARVSVTVQDGTATITLSNPARRNALSSRMLIDLAAALRELSMDPAVSSVVLRGEGREAFAAGADIYEFEAQQTEREASIASDEAIDALFAAIDAVQIPIIAMIHGYCFGAGLALALACDLRLCDETARFSIPAAKLGLGYPVPQVRTLVDVVGPAFASEILVTGRVLDATEAAAMRLVNRVVPADALEGAVLELAGQIAANAPLSIRAARLAIRAALDPSQAGMAYRAAEAAKHSEDAREGQRAFREKRWPVYQGR